MPKYNGVLAYPCEALLHLLWCYVVFVVAFGLLISTPVILEWWFGNSSVPHQGDLVRWIGDARLLLLSGAHLAIFGGFRHHIWPRFPFAPPLLTFTISAAFGSAILAGIFAFDAPERGDYLFWFLILVGISLLGGLADRFNYYWGGGFGAPLALGRWFGRVLVGREAYDAFVEQEAARLNKEYEEHRQKVTRTKAKPDED